MRVQLLLCIYAGAPIFLIMPILIYGPKIVLSFLHSLQESNTTQLPWHQRLLKQLLGMLGVLPALTAIGYRDQHRRRLQTISFYWEDRFVFAVLRWLSFIAFIAASTAIQVAPSPISCSGITPPFTLVADPAFTCYSEELAVAHTVGFAIAVLICVVLPYYIYHNVRRISFNDREEDPRESERFGAFFGSYRKGPSQYFFLLNHFQMTVLISVLSLLLQTNELGLAISNLVLSLAYMLTVVIGRPFTHTFDSVLEAATTGVQAYGILLSIVRLVDENAISEYTGEVTKPI
jgi:hypothetical protein